MLLESLSYEQSKLIEFNDTQIHKIIRDVRQLDNLFRTVKIIQVYITMCIE